MGCMPRLFRRWPDSPVLDPFFRPSGPNHERRKRSTLLRLLASGRQAHETRCSAAQKFKPNRENRQSMPKYLLFLGGFRGAFGGPFFRALPRLLPLPLISARIRKHTAAMQAVLGRPGVLAHRPRSAPLPSYLPQVWSWTCSFLFDSFHL